MNRIVMPTGLVLLVMLAAEAQDKKVVAIPASVLEDKLRGGLLGEIIGDLNGLKHEMKYITEPGNVESDVPMLAEGAWADDDTDIEWIYVLETERSKESMFSPQRITELWKRHINRRIWCSHQYLRQLIDIGIQPPLTGRIAVNPRGDFNLSGQFVSETWGMISPGMPQTAARLGLHYTHVSIEGEPSQSTQRFAAMISTAYLTSDIQRILDAGEAALDPRSECHQIIRDVRRWHGRNPGDWRATMQALFYESPIPAGEAIREKAIAAGLVKPEQKIQLWKEDRTSNERIIPVPAKDSVVVG